MRTLFDFLNTVNVGETFGVYLPTEQYTKLSVFLTEDGAITNVATQKQYNAEVAYVSLSLARRAEELKDAGKDLDETFIVRFVRAVDGLHLLA